MKSVLSFNVADLRAELGKKREFQFSEPVEKIEILTAQVADVPVNGDLVLESIDQGISITGFINFEWIAECRRCLEPIQRQCRIECDEIFIHDADKDGEAINFDGYQIHFKPVLHEILAASLPLAPLCKQACQGPDPERYPTGV